MDAGRFDDVVRSLTNASSRREVLTGLVAATLGLGMSGITSAGNGKKRKKKPKLNEFGCVNVGGKCRGKNALCCSGLCQGKKPKKGKKDKSRCVAHDESTCQPGQNACGGPEVACVRDGGDFANGLCFTTTGNAQFCGREDESPDCVPCKQDTECVERCGPNAACVKCMGEQCPGQAAVCVGRDVDCSVA